MSKYITAQIDVMGGQPVVAGTRIPIEIILHRLKEGHSVKQIHDLYPWVDVKTLEGAIEEAIQLINTTFHAKNLSQV